MKYFSSFIPTITTTDATFYDMFNNFNIDTDIEQEFLTIYSMVEGELLQDVAYKFYGDPQLWWLVALTNGITDTFFDIANTNEYVQQIAEQVAIEDVKFWGTGEDEDTFWWSGDAPYLDSDYFWWFEEADYIMAYDEATDYNEEKRQINVIKPEFLSTVMSQIMAKVNE